MRRLLHTACIAVASSLTTVFLLAACTAGYSARSPGAPTAEPPATRDQATNAHPAVPPVALGGARAQAAQNPAVEVYQRNGASVVNITSVAVLRTGFGTAEQPRGVGSGFILDNEGRIVTNNHVVEEADQLTVTFQDRTTVPARLVGRDPDNDLAVIQVDTSNTDEEGRSVRDRIKPVTLADSSQITIGEDAIAIGSPLGLQQTVTAGIVSALRNPLEEAGRSNLELLGGAIQTDASINPGNSGGPLFNAAGEVIGVNTAILSQSGGNEGIGFAIPVNVVKRVAPELIQTGRYRHPLIGVAGISLSQIGQGAKQQLGISLNQKGLLVQESSAGGYRTSHLRRGTGPN